MKDGAGSVAPWREDDGGELRWMGFSIFGGYLTLWALPPTRSFGCIPLLEPEAA